MYRKLSDLLDGIGLPLWSIGWIRQSVTQKSKPLSMQMLPEAKSSWPFWMACYSTAQIGIGPFVTRRHLILSQSSVSVPE